MAFVSTVTVGQFAQAAKSGKLEPNVPTGFSGHLGQIVSTMMLADVKDRFDKSNEPDGTPWASLRFPRVNGGNKPLLDTGIMRASLFAGHSANTVYVATTHPGAALQNFGGRVTGKGKMLAIPLTKAAKRAGSPRRFGAPLSFRPTRKGRKFLLIGPGGTAEFLLVDSVDVRARRFMGLSDQASKRIDMAILEASERGWLGGK